LELLRSIFAVTPLEAMKEPDRAILSAYWNELREYERHCDERLNTPPFEREGLIVTFIALAVIEAYYEVHVVWGPDVGHDYSYPLVFARELMYKLHVFFRHKQKYSNAGVKLLVKFLGLKSTWEAGVSPAAKGFLDGDFVITNRVGTQTRYSWSGKVVGSVQESFAIAGGFYANSLEQHSIAPVTDGKRLVIVVCEKRNLRDRMRRRTRSLESLGFAVIVLTTMGSMTRSQCQILRQLFALKDELGALVLAFMDQDVIDFTVKLIYKQSGFQSYIVPFKQEFANASSKTSHQSKFAMDALKRMARTRGDFLSASCPPGDLEDRVAAIREVSCHALLFLSSIH
jgi:hypothetical protein